MATLSLTIMALQSNARQALSVGRAACAVVAPAARCSLKLVRCLLRLALADALVEHLSYPLHVFRLPQWQD